MYIGKMCIKKFGVMVVVSAMVFASFFAIGVQNAAGSSPKTTSHGAVFMDMASFVGKVLPAADTTEADWVSGTDTGWVRIYFYPRSNELGDIADYSNPQSALPSYLVDHVGATGNTGTARGTTCDLQGFPTEWAPLSADDDLVGVVDKYVGTTKTGYTTSGDFICTSDDPQEFPYATLYKIPSVTFTASSIDWSLPAGWDGNGNVYGFRIYESDTEAGLLPVNPDTSNANCLPSSANVIGNVTGNTTSTFSYTPVANKWYAISVLYRGQVGGAEDYTTVVESLYRGAPSQYTLPEYQPDLIIDGVGDNVYAPTEQSSSKDVVAGNNATYTIVVQNEKDADTINFALDTTGLLAGWTAKLVNTTTWAEVTSVTLSAGGSDTLQLNISTPGTATPGQSSNVIVTGTSAGEGTKSDAVKAVATITEPYKPDMQIKRDDEAAYTGGNIYESVPSSSQTVTNNTIVGGETAYFDIKVENDGSSADTINITMTSGGVALSGAALFDGANDITGQVTGGSKYPIPLASLASHTLSLRITTLATANPGEKAWGIVTGTSQNGTGKSDAVNGTASIKQNYGVHVDAPADQSGNPGATLTYTFTITNTGNGADTISYTADSESDWTVNPTSGSVSIGAGASTTVDIDITIPSSPAPAAGATDKLWLNATCSDSLTTDQNFTTTTVNAVYDFTISSTSQAYEAFGKTYNLTLTITNIGNMADSYNYDGNYTTTAELVVNSIGPLSTPSIGASGTTPIWVNFTTNAVGGTQYIYVNYTSVGNSSVKRQGSITVAAGEMDFYGITAEYPSPASTELTYTISVKVTGTDYTPTPLTVTVKLYINGAEAESISVSLTTTNDVKYANFTDYQFTSDFTLRVTATSTPADPNYDNDNTVGSDTIVIKAVTIPAAPTTSFEPTLIGVGIAVLVVAVLGTVVIWRKKKEKKKTEE